MGTFRFKKPQWVYDVEPDDSGDRFAVWDSPLGMFKVYFCQQRQRFCLIRPICLAGMGGFDFDRLEDGVTEAESLAEMVFSQLGEMVALDGTIQYQSSSSWVPTHDLGEPVG
jgi:hypothetical protein